MGERWLLLVIIAQRGISGNREAFCFTNAMLMSQYLAPVVRMQVCGYCDNDLWEIVQWSRFLVAA